jgi:hypothetical protein
MSSFQLTACLVGPTQAPICNPAIYISLAHYDSMYLSLSSAAEAFLPALFADAAASAAAAELVLARHCEALTGAGHV